MPRPIAAAAPAAGGMVALEFDFEHRHLSRVDAGEARRAIEAGRFLWVDIDVAGNGDSHGEIVQALGVPDGGDLASLIGRAQDVLVRRDEMIVFTLPLPSSGMGELSSVALVLADRHLVTVHRGGRSLMERARSQAEHDFDPWARTPGFLLFEIAGRVIDAHRSELRDLEARLAALRSRLRTPADPREVEAVGDVDAALVRERRALLDVRDVLDDLATRRSALVSETTQPFLAGQATAAGRLADDAVAARDLASSTLALYVATTGSRAAKALGRLTGITVVFLPMLFTVQIIRADLDWTSPWSALWALAVAFVVSVVVYMRRHRLL